MSKTAKHWLGQSLAVVAAAALLSGCVEETPLGPELQEDVATPAAAVAASDYRRAPDLGACDSLQAPSGSKLVLRVFAEGVQIYHWNGTSWVFDGPSAVLYAAGKANGKIGTHYAGPTWESNSGSKVVGTVLKRCTPDAASIPWLLLGAVSAQGPGIFRRVTSIQRVNTVGGNAPATPGTVIGQEARVPYTTDYYFYR